MSELFNRIVSFENLYEAYKKTQSGASKFRASALRFYMDETQKDANFPYQSRHQCIWFQSLDYSQTIERRL